MSREGRVRHSGGMVPDLDERLRAASDLDAEALTDLGHDLAEADRPADAESCWRRASENGSVRASFNLGNCLAGQQRWLESMSAFKLAIARGDTEAWINIGWVLHELGDLAGEIKAYQSAEAAGESGGPLGLAFALREQGDRDGALAAAQRSAAAGNETGAAVVACWQWCSSFDPALEPALRAGAEHFPSTRADLAQLLLNTDRVDAARQVLERGMELGEVESMLPLGNLYADVLNDRDAAERAYRAGIALGDAHSHHNLGLLLQENGDFSGAEQHYRAAIDGGDTLAVNALRDLLDGEGLVED